MTRKCSTGWSSPRPRPIYAPPSWPSPAPSHPKETAAPVGSQHPHKEKHHPARRSPSRGVWGQRWGETPLGWQHWDFSGAFLPSFLNGWRSPLGAHEWTCGHHPSALRDDIFCTKNPFVSMFYIYIAHFKMLMQQRFCTWLGPLRESPGPAAQGPESFFQSGNPRAGGQTSSKVLEGQELQDQLCLPNFSMLYGMIGTTFLCWSWMVRLVLCTLGSLYFSGWGGGLSGGCCGITYFMNQKILHEKCLFWGV